jgi:hypothetical protein
VHVVKIPVVKGSRDLVPNTISRPISRIAATRPRRKREKSYELGSRYKPKNDFNFIGRA